VSYSPDGRRIVSGGDRVWNAETAAELAVLRGHEGSVYSMWDAESGAELAVLRGHEGSVYSVSYKP